MRRRLVCLALSLGCAALLAPLRADTPTKDAPAPRTLPGTKGGGTTLLPNGWTLHPAGKQVPMGDFPVNLALHPGGEWLAVLHAGAGEHNIALVNLKRQKVVSRVVIDQAFYGLCFSPDGRRLYASGGEDEVVHGYDFADGYLSRHREIKIVDPKEKFIPAGLAIDPRGNLAVAGPWGDAVVLTHTEQPNAPRKVPLGKESFPYACLFDRDGDRLFVSLWNKAAVAVIDRKSNEVSATWPTESHPTEMVLSPDGKTLFVACANSTKVTVLDAAKGTGLQTIACSLYPAVPKGNTPNSLCLTPDGKMLFVANADANNLAVFNVAAPGEAKPLGFIPVGWYPTAVRYNAADKRLYVANGKGDRSFANPQGPQPNVPAGQQSRRQYIAELLRGTLSVIDLPDPDRMAKYSKDAYSCSPLKADQGVTAPRPQDSPIPGKPGETSPIKNVIYVIKENRTYDQVFGDVKEGNGDAALCLFPEKVTPNHHKLVREFVLLDNFYCDGEVSANGHEWSMGAYATDFVERVWPLVYRPEPRKKIGYPAEGSYAIATPAGGYIWDRCAEAKVTYRSYGEWVSNAAKVGDPGKARSKALEGHIDPLFRGFDLDYPDQKRADRFIEQLKGFEEKGEMPQLIILRLPNDHTSGTKAGSPTPTAYVADNDLALGRVVEAVSQSKFWKQTAIFVVEDDAQNGPDHVDAHRTVALVISPWTKRKHVDSSMYSTASMLRTMELILGLKPMSQFDAAARPMYASFQGKADETPYVHVMPQADLGAKNTRTAWGSKLSEKFNLAKEDAVDDQLFNEVIWRSVKGADSPMPPPVRAAFVFPHLKEKKDKDDDD
ncbi:MAG TPA: SMP-30/gluconolactonase/LRE family protein [Gemmataceae bacterium]|nr:SMP-30/gluconolactonase/LRE family protein [Gemmataceae bacterium]